MKKPQFLALLLTAWQPAAFSLYSSIGDYVNALPGPYGWRPAVGWSRTSGMEVSKSCATVRAEEDTSSSGGDDDLKSGFHPLINTFPFPNFHFRQVVEEVLRKDLAECLAFSSSSDEWTSPATEQYVGATIYIVKDYQRVSIYLKLTPLAGAANAENITSILINALQETGGLTLADIARKFIGFTSDGASVMQGDISGVKTRLMQYAPRLLPAKCAAHSLQLVGAGSLTDGDLVEKLLELCKKAYLWFSNSGDRRRQFVDVKAECGVKDLELLELVATRWSSRRAVVERLYELFPALLVFFDRYTTLERGRPRPGHVEAVDVFRLLVDYEVHVAMSLSLPLFRRLDIFIKELQDDNLYVLDLVRKLVKISSDVTSDFIGDTAYSAISFPELYKLINTDLLDDESPYHYSKPPADVLQEDGCELELDLNGEGRRCTQCNGASGRAGTNKGRLFLCEGCAVGAEHERLCSSRPSSAFNINMPWLCVSCELILRTKEEAHVGPEPFDMGKERAALISAREQAVLDSMAAYTRKVYVVKIGDRAEEFELTYKPKGVRAGARQAGTATTVLDVTDLRHEAVLSTLKQVTTDTAMQVLDSIRRRFPPDNLLRAFSVVDPRCVRIIVCQV